MVLQKLYAADSLGIYGDNEIVFFKPSTALLDEIVNLPSGSLVGIQTVRQDTIFNDDSPYIKGFYPEFTSHPYWKNIMKSCPHLSFTHLDDLLYWRTLLEDARKFFQLEGKKKDQFEKKLLFRVSVEHGEIIRNRILERKPRVVLVGHAIAQYLMINNRGVEYQSLAHDKAEHFIGKAPEKIIHDLTGNCSRIPNVLTQSIEIESWLANAFEKRLKEFEGGN